MIVLPSGPSRSSGSKMLTITQISGFAALFAGSRVLVSMAQPMVSVLAAFALARVAWVAGANDPSATVAASADAPIPRVIVLPIPSLMPGALLYHLYAIRRWYGFGVELPIPI